MTGKLTQSFGRYVTDTVFDALATNTKLSYILAAKHTEFDNDMSPPDPSSSINSESYETYGELIFGKKINSEDVSFAIKNNIWTSDTIYAMYDDKTDNLHDTNFFVVTVESNEYSVFKCLYNANGATSEVRPVLSLTQETDEYFETSDGYVWKYMFTVGAADYNKFATLKYLPVTENATVKSNAIDGAIDFISVTTSGSDYKSHATGVIQQTEVDGNVLKYYIDSNDTLSADDNFYKNSSIYISDGNGAGQIRLIDEYGAEGNYKYVIISDAFTTVPDVSSTFSIAPSITIQGDGVGALAKAKMDTATNTLTDIEIINRGEGYTFANVSITANSGIVDLNGDAVFSVDAEARVIISPKGGHGADVKSELGATNICISCEFDGNDHPTANDFRKIVILNAPLFDDISLNVVSTADFSVGEVITQESTSATATITSVDSATAMTLENVSGLFEVGSIENENTDTTTITSVEAYDNIDVRTKITISNNTVDFVQDEVISQLNTNAEGIIHEIIGNDIYITNMKGSFGTNANDFVSGSVSNASATISNIELPKLKHNSGDLFYIETTQPVTRDDTLKEQLKTVIKF